MPPSTPERTEAVASDASPKASVRSPRLTPRASHGKDARATRARARVRTETLDGVKGLLVGEPLVGSPPWLVLFFSLRLHELCSCGPEPGAGEPRAGGPCFFSPRRCPPIIGGLWYHRIVY